MGNVFQFFAATLLPGGSEAILLRAPKCIQSFLWPTLGVATLGNTLGGMISYACGRWLPRWQKFDVLPGHERVQRWGAPFPLLLSWAPLIGDARNASLQAQHA